MKSGLLKILLVVFIVIIYAVTTRAFLLLGAEEGMVFITDFGHAWRAQFNTDFSLHIALLIAWVVWREQSLPVGIICGLGCLLGGLFTFPYLLFSLVRCNGDLRKLLLGRHAPTIANPDT